MRDWLGRLHPFRTPDARRLALLFAIVYFAQGMWYLPNQTVKAVLNEQGVSAGQIGTFFAVATMAWNVKPLYGLISDFFPLFGRRRKSYFLLTTSLAAATGLYLGLVGAVSPAMLAVLIGTMGLGLAFTDVLTDALMVENGRTLGLTGAFQSVQWGAINTATILVGVGGGYLAKHRALRPSFLLAAAFPLVSLAMAAKFIREPRAPRDTASVRATWRAVRDAFRERDIWMVAAFVSFWAFSPSLGSSLFVHQTNVLGVPQERIGLLDSIAAAAGILGAAVYAPLSRKFPLTRLIVGAIGIGVASSLAFLFYTSFPAAIAIHAISGCLGTSPLLAILDLAARACPRRVEATFFALLMSLNNTAMSLSDAVGGYLYGWLGYTALVLISATMTAMAWLLVPLVHIDRIEAKARAESTRPDSPPPAPT
ncbi:MAG TPA: MFS transporter [Candidatus Limnocylindrales bacterium]|nr:MFS transporter [Candidatus Limnocylindrales bacterium]